ncbi:hypothetical protein Taro_046033 [Colocasia esculenta]|uniref:Protein phosphatase n=1 Tax=Colocasia esculenta TaxID=4460 RepID=A0A843WSQ9_COLES|nr:hypothetical protein [Colocasia esculenta]
MIAGAFYIPHQDKRPLGEDAFFIAKGGRVIGVADGVGSWRAHGVDAGKFARELMCRSESLVGSWPCGATDPAKILEKAASKTTSKGTATACIIALKGKWLHAAVVGDSGFAVIREGNVIYRSPQQQKSFNQPYQLGAASSGDAPLDALRITFAVERGDLVVAGSDGLFDNLFDHELAGVLVSSKKEGRERVDDLAYDVAQAALASSLDKTRRTPFSEACREAGEPRSGGKQDDITVVVVRVVCTCD